MAPINVGESYELLLKKMCVTLKVLEMLKKNRVSLEVDGERNNFFSKLPVDIGTLFVPIDS